MLKIDYETSGFPHGAPVTNGHARLDTTWDDLLWSALTVGRPNRQHVFQHGLASTYEALFRLSLVRMALEQSGPMAYRLRRTAAARSLDPSEKGAVNYFLGMNFCKLFAASKLDAPWMLHLDVFRPQLDPVLSGRSRPDLIAETLTGDWLAFESKGRASPPDAKAKQKAKQQAQRCLSVSGTAVSYHIGAITYFRGDVLNFFWCDPPSNESMPMNVEDAMWRHYYSPTLELIRRDSQVLSQMLQQPVLAEVPEASIKIGIVPRVLRLLVEQRWGEAKQVAHAATTTDEGLQGYHPDGIRVVAGSSWSLPFAGTEPQLH